MLQGKLEENWDSSECRTKFGKEAGHFFLIGMQLGSEFSDFGTTSICYGSSEIIGFASGSRIPCVCLNK